MHRARLALGASLSISPSGHLMLAIVLFLPLVRPLKAISVHADRWITTCADCPKYVMEATDRNLQLDTQGLPHITYGGDHLYYAWYDGTAWRHETADRSRGVGQYAALALSASGQPHISYYDGLNGNLKYAYRDNVGWHSETIDTGGADTDTGLYTSIAVDSNGYSHISYYDITNRDLKYAFEGAAGWVIETPDSVGDVGGYTSLALGPDLEPQISYCRLQYESSQYVCDALKHAAHGDAGWQVEIVDEEEYPGDHAGAYNSLVIDGTGQPHISYGAWNGVLGSRLKYAYQDAEGWHIEVVGTGSSGFYYTSLSLDGDGYPHISYYDGGRLSVRSPRL